MDCCIPTVLKSGRAEDLSVFYFCCCFVREKVFVFQKSGAVSRNKKLDLTGQGGSESFH